MKTENIRLLLSVVAMLVPTVACSPAQTAQEKPNVSTPAQRGNAASLPAPPKHTNRLIHATSPYLLQHAHNPVDWYEWGKEAFEKAQREDKLIFLSIGYSACHWCHVMEHESFETEEVAAVLNKHFVSIKVDREERPDVDEIYMAYTQALTHSGGWPMSIWLTPDRAPFHAGTYLPKVQFLQTLGSISEAWTNEREKILAASKGAKDFFKRWASGPPAAEGIISMDQVDRLALSLAKNFDGTLGGISSPANKFPPSMTMDLLLRVYHRTNKTELYDAVTTTLDHMARGGIYDHIGGGICRYSTDPQWLVPHFEKMLYDQAMVSSIYLDAYLISKEPLYARTARDILDFVLREFQSPEGGFYSAFDADSDGLEGAYYIWTVDQITEVLGNDESKLFCAFFDVTEKGNWFERLGHAPPGPKNILHIAKPRAAFAKLHSMSADELDHMIDNWREKLRATRSRRIPPGLDDKVLTAWNGLMIASLAKGARVLDEPRFAESAATAARVVLQHLRKDGRLLRTRRNGESRLKGYLSDYAFFVEGLLNLYEATFDPIWLNEARNLTDTSIRHYFDENNGAFFFVADDAEELLARSKQPHDNAIPSGNAVQAMNLLRLSILFGRPPSGSEPTSSPDYREKAESIFKTMGAQIEQAPGAFDRMLCAIDFYHDRVKEIAIIGDPKSPQTKALLRVVFDRYLPNKVVAYAYKDPGMGAIPLLRGKTLRKGQPAAYVCESYRCKRPVTEPEALVELLESK